jgi:uncharacterized membrane protein
MIIGFIFIAFTVLAALPFGLGWGSDIIAFLKGGSPVLAAFIGLIAIFVGIADIRDKREAKKKKKSNHAQKNKKAFST